MENSINTKSKIRQFILNSAYMPEEQIKDETLLFVHGLLDSMGFISLISFLEETFSITADDSELLESNFESINAITSFVLRKLNHNHLFSADENTVLANTNTDSDFFKAI